MDQRERFAGPQNLHADVNSAGLGINDRGEAVGVSFDEDGDPRGFLWRNDVMTDLNTLVPTDSPLFLLFAHSINSRGDIVGFGADSDGEVHAFLANPCDFHYGDSEWCKDHAESATAEMNEAMERPKVVMTTVARKLLQRRMRFRLFPDQSAGQQ